MMCIFSKNISLRTLVMVFLLATLWGAPMFLYAQGGFFPNGLIPCGTEVNTVSTAEEGTVGAVPKSNQCDFDDLLQLGKNIINFLVLLSIPLAAIAFAWAGFLYLTSAGSEGKVDKAKQIFWKVLWGFIFVLTAWLIVYTITYFLAPGFSFLQ